MLKSTDNLSNITQNDILSQVSKNNQLSNLFIVDCINDSGDILFNPFNIVTIEIPKPKQRYKAIPFMDRTVAVKYPFSGGMGDNLRFEKSIITIQYYVGENYCNYSYIDYLYNKGNTPFKTTIYKLINKPEGLNSTIGESPMFNGVSDKDLSNTVNSIITSKDGMLTEESQLLSKLSGVGRVEQLATVFNNYNLTPLYTFKDCVIISNIFNNLSFDYSNSNPITATCEIHFTE